MVRTALEKEASYEVLGSVSVTGISLIHLSTDFYLKFVLRTFRLAHGVSEIQDSLTPLS